MGEILTEYFCWKMFKLNLSMRKNHVGLNVALFTDNCLGLCKTEKWRFPEVEGMLENGKKLAEVSQEA